MKSERTFTKFLFLCVSILLISVISFAQTTPSGELAKSYVAYLASDALEGRDTSTPGFEQAAKWVANKFAKWGLEPAGENGGYFQEFPFKYYKADFQYPQLIIDKRNYYSQDDDFRVLRYSGGGKIKGEVVFVGYGMSAPEKNFDEYAGVDVHKKIALIMRGAPGDDEDDWNGLDGDSAKVVTAMKHGAIGVLICAPFDEKERGVGRWRLQPGNYRENFLVYGVDERVVQYLLKKEGESNRTFLRRMQKLQKKLDNDLTPISMSTGKKAKMRVKVEFDPWRTGKNVLAMIRGTDPEIGDEIIIVGAHLDHLGVKYGLIYNGADDNASGSATVLEVARVMMKNKVKPKRTIVFACWGGEERGLLGSFYYGKHPLFPIEKTVLNFNIDMVGIGDKLGFPGIYYAPNIWNIIKENISEETLEFIEPRRGGPGGSDHTPFIIRGIPAFALMTSPWTAHSDYHQPQDDAEKINAELMGKVANFVYDNTLLIANYKADLIVENRLPLYIHKSAVIANLNPIPYADELSVLDSLQQKWIDVQFVEVTMDSLENPSARLLDLLKSLDEAAEDKSNFFSSQKSRPPMFRSQSEKTKTIVGLHGAESVNGDIAYLRMAAKLGAKYFIIDGIDGKWINTDQGLTDDGKKAIKAMNKGKMLIIVQNIPDSTVERILETSKQPVVIVGKMDAASLSDDFLAKVKENGGLLVFGFCPLKESEKLAEQFISLKDRLPLTYLGVCPGFGRPVNYQHLDKLLNFTIALKEKDIDDGDIKGILGGNLRRVFGKINPELGKGNRRHN